MGLMSRILLVVLVLAVAKFATAEVHDTYQILPGVSEAVKVSQWDSNSDFGERGEVLKLRVKMKKYTIVKTEEGPKIKFEDVCEKNVNIEVRDYTKGGGGLIQEETIMACGSTIKGKNVTVVLSGMIYDNNVADFSDETKDWTRNFFAHLQLSSSEIIFGLGDFNLDTTRDKKLSHLSASLSVDPQFGGESKVREGFTTRVRYGR